MTRQPQPSSPVNPNRVQAVLRESEADLMARQWLNEPQSGRPASEWPTARIRASQLPAGRE
jgi:hypothetical protein